MSPFRAAALICGAAFLLFLLATPPAQSQTPALESTLTATASPTSFATGVPIVSPTTTASPLSASTPTTTPTAVASQTAAPTATNTAIQTPTPSPAPTPTPAPILRLAADDLTLDAQLARVALRSPGFGGMFSEGGRLKVHMVTPPGQAQIAASARALAESGIAAVFGRERIAAPGVDVLPAEYTFLQLKAWHDRMGSLFAVSQVVFTDIDEKANRLVVATTDAGAFGSVQQELARLGIPLQAVNLKVSPPVTQAATLRDEVRPLESGTQIQFLRSGQPISCTQGFHATRLGTQGFVVNSHCTTQQGGVEGTDIYQPTSGVGNLAGVETADPQYTNASCPEGTPETTQCRWSDTAFSERVPGVPASRGSIARPDGVNTGSLNIAGHFNIVDEGASLMGDTVNKVGRTTGWSQGNVTMTCVTAVVGGTNFRLVCQDFVAAGFGGGDSGSPVFAITSGTDVQLRGLVWGGIGTTTFVYSPIANIERSDELGELLTIAPAVEISLLTDANLAFGVQALSVSVDTSAAGINDVQTVQVVKGPADLYIKTTAFTDGNNTWSLGTTIGPNQAVWQYSTNGTTYTL